MNDESNLTVVPNPYVLPVGETPWVCNLMDGSIHELDPEQVKSFRSLLKDRTKLIDSTLFELLERGLVLLRMQQQVLRDEYRQMIVEFLSSSAALCIMPTEKCNLRCTYCYEGFERGRMSE
jgi:uncharacterized protein